MAGDIILLETGARVPADCIIVEAQDLSVDESFYNTGENKAIKKQHADDSNYSQGADPFLLSNSFIVTGAAKAVVCAVGKYSRRGIHDEKLDTETKTPLQEKL